MNRFIDVVIAISTGFLVSMVSQMVVDFKTYRKRQLLAKQFLPVSQIKRDVERVVTIFHFIAYFSSAENQNPEKQSLPTSEELVQLIGSWDMGGSIPHLMPNLLFNAEQRHVDSEPTFADGFCNEIQNLIIGVDNFVYSSTFAYINLDEQSKFLSFIAAEFTHQFKREIGGDTGLKGAYSPQELLTSDICHFADWIPIFFQLVEVINKYIESSEERMDTTRVR